MTYSMFGMTTDLGKSLCITRNGGYVTTVITTELGLLKMKSSKSTMTGAQALSKRGKGNGSFLGSYKLDSLKTNEKA